MHPTILALRLKAFTQTIQAIVGDPAGDMRRRVIDGCARAYVLRTDRPTRDIKSLLALTDPPPDRDRSNVVYGMRLPGVRYILDAAGRNVVLERIRRGNLGIEERLGIWNGCFWAGLRASGAIRQGPGTEWRIWERSHRELLDDLAGMPLMKRLAPRAAKHGQRRLRRCYGMLLPPEDGKEASILAGLFAGAAMRTAGDEAWMELPDNELPRGILTDWGIPFRSFERQNRRKVLLVSPFYAVLVAHLMPPRSTERVLGVRKAGECPFLPSVLWQMALTRKNMRYVPFAGALPFSCSRATFFRRGWRRRDLNRIGWLDMGIRVTPKLRALTVQWFERQSAERKASPPHRSVVAIEPEAAPPSLDQNTLMTVN